MAVALVLSCSLLALAANLALQMACHRWLFASQLVRSLAIGFGTGIAVLVVGFCIALGLFGGTSAFPSYWHWAGGLVIYGAGSFTVLCLIAAGETSVRVQILRVLRSAPDGMTMTELDQFYSNRSLLRVRLQRLIDSGAVRKDQGRYYLSSLPLLIIARLFRTARLIIFGVASEFDRASGRHVPVRHVPVQGASPHRNDLANE